jgi:SCP-2 sterol transfer family
MSTCRLLKRARYLANRQHAVRSTAEDGSASVSQYPFLSDEWLAQARQIRAEFKGKAAPIPVSIRMNQIIHGVPFGEGTVNAHVDTSSGELEIETGHLDAPDLTITIDYDTAKAILVDGDAQAAMQAFLGGKIKVDGDITKMMALQGTGGGDPAAAELARRLQDITS